MKEQLRQWLLKHGFLDFKDGLTKCGVQGFEDLVLLTKEDLQELTKTLGLNLVMRRKFLNAVQDISTPRLEIQQLIRKLQVNSDALVSTLQSHCSLVCSLATKVGAMNTGVPSHPASASQTLLARPKSDLRRQGSVKRSRSQHFFSAMELEKITNEANMSSEKPSAPKKKTNDPPPEKPKPKGPKPPMVQVMGVVPNIKPPKIKIYVEELPDVTYVLAVSTAGGEDTQEYDDPNKIVYTKVQAGKSYRVKMAAKSKLGVLGDWSEIEPAILPEKKETVVILGGDVEYEENLNVTEYYIDKEKSWQIQPEFNLTTERTRVGATVWGGNVVIIGGSEKSAGHINLVQKYDFESKRWEKMAPTKFIRHSHKVGVVDGKLFVVGGYGTRGTGNKRFRFLDVMEMYDSSEKQWIVHPVKMKLPRKDFGMAVIDDEIFVCGGESNSRIIADCEVFGYTASSWLNISSMNEKRRQFGCCEYGGRMWVAGGFQGGSKKKSVLVSVEMYDPHEDVWFEQAPLTEPRYGCTLQKMNDKLLCIGGYNTTHDPINTIEVFDFESNQWRRWKTRLKKKRGSHEAVVLEQWF